jgi:cyclophilin family peptidyl-prolyl cis-trans isomerase
MDYPHRVTYQLIACPRLHSFRKSLLPVVALILIQACSASPPAESDEATASSTAKSSGGSHAVIETEKGTIELELLEMDQPKAVENFRLLAERGFYNGLTFHRIVKGFMIQGGDPSGDGTGGESAWGDTFEDAINRDSALYRDGYRRGLVAMANAGPDTNGSQFFIMHQDYELPPDYVIFAKVIKGMEVVDALAETPTRRGPDGGMSEPLTPPKMTKVTIRP